jgi:hypothetical protein
MSPGVNIGIFPHYITAKVLILAFNNTRSTTRNKKKLPIFNKEDCYYLLPKITHYSYSK